MKTSRIVVLLLIAALAPWLLTACGGDDDDPAGSADTARSENAGAGQTLKLGSIFATSGPGAAFGPQQVRGAELAIEQINKDGGIDGAQLELVQRDEGGDPAKAARNAQVLAQRQNVLAILGPTFSNSAAEAHPLADQLGVAMLAVSNTGPGIVGDCPYSCELVFRDSLGEQTAIPANIESFVEESGLGAGSAPGTAVVIHPDGDPFGESSAGIAQQAFADAGLEETPVAHGDAAVRRALQMTPEVVMVTASSGEVAAEMIKGLRDGGFEGTILGGNAFNSRLTGELAGAAGKGARSAAAWFEGNPAEENQEFITAYEAAYGEAPDQFAAQAYSGVLLLAEAADDADLSFSDLIADRLALVDALIKVEEDTPLGEISFTDDRDISQPIWIVEMDGKGGFTEVKEIPAP